MKLHYKKKECDGNGERREIFVELDDEEAKVIVKELISQLSTMLYLELGRSLFSFFKKSLFVVFLILTIYFFIVEARLTDWLKGTLGLGFLGVLGILSCKDLKMDKPNNSNTEKRQDRHGKD